MEFSHQNEHVRSYSIYKHDTTLKMAFGAFFFFYNFNTGPPSTIEPLCHTSIVIAQIETKPELRTGGEGWRGRGETQINCQK